MPKRQLKGRGGRSWAIRSIKAYLYLLADASSRGEPGEEALNKLHPFAAKIKLGCAHQADTSDTFKLDGATLELGSLAKSLGKLRRRNMPERASVVRDQIAQLQGITR